jgi:hypothetical protein
MVERMGRTGTSAARFRGPSHDGGAAALAATLLGVPVAFAAATTTLVAGGGFASALLAYGLAGACALATVAASLGRPRRAPVLAALRRRVRLGPAPARLLGR